MSALPAVPYTLDKGDYVSVAKTGHICSFLGVCHCRSVNQHLFRLACRWLSAPQKEFPFRRRCIEIVRPHW